MTHPSDHTPTEVDGRQELDSDTLPRRSLLLVSAALGAGALVGFTANSVFLLWVRLGPKPSSVFAFLETIGLSSLHMWCITILLYVPNVLLMVVLAFLIGWFFPRMFVPLTTAFVIAESFTKLALYGTNPWWSMLEHARAGDHRGAFGYVVMTVVVYGLPFLSAWLASRHGNGRAREGDCSKFEYPSKDGRLGVVQSAESDPGPGAVQFMRVSKIGKYLGLAHRQSGRTPVRRSTSRAKCFYARCVSCIVLYTGFWYLPEELLSRVLRDILVLLLSCTGVHAVASFQEGYPGLVADGRVNFFNLECTYLDLVLIVAPFLWVFGASLRRNLMRIAIAAVVILVANLIRTWAAVYFYVRGIDWFYTHDLPDCIMWWPTVAVVVLLALRRDFGNPSHRRANSLRSHRAD